MFTFIVRYTIQGLTRVVNHTVAVNAANKAAAENKVRESESQEILAITDVYQLEDEEVFFIY